MAVQSESDGTSVQGHLIRMRCTRTVGVRALRDDTGINSQHHIEYSPVALGVVAQPLWHRQHPLAQRQPVKDVMGKVLGRLNHARCVTRGGADAPTRAGIGHKVVVPAISTIKARAKSGANMPHSRCLQKAWRK